MKYSWLWEVWLAIDRLLSAICGGWADETISARLWRLEQSGDPVAPRLRRLVDWLSGNPHHCAASFAMEQARREQPPAAREQQSAVT